MALVLAALGGLLVGLRALQKFASPHPEIVRKILHISMGLVTLSFPWLFDEGWPVLTLAVLSIALLLSLRLVKKLRTGVGNVVCAVGRTSFGEIYFPIAVAILFQLYLYFDEQPARGLLLYCIPILMLTIADAAAALIGIAYGRTHYLTSEGRKSAEGSLAFFMCSFFCVHIPLLLGANLGKTETLLIALLMAMLVMMFEAVAWNGLDNLLLPLASYLLLRMYWSMTIEDLLLRLAVTGALIAILVVFTARSTLVGNAVLGAFLVGYLSWTLGGLEWLLPPLLLFLTYTWFAPHSERNQRRVHHIHAVVCVASAGLFWLFLARILNRDDFLLPYTVAYSAHLAIIGIARMKNCYPQWSCACVVRKAVLTSWLILFIPYLVAQSMLRGEVSVSTALSHSLLIGLIGLGGVSAAALTFYCTQPNLHDCPLDARRWFRQAAHAGVGSVAGLLPLYVF